MELSIILQLITTLAITAAGIFAGVQIILQETKGKGFYNSDAAINTNA